MMDIKDIIKWFIPGFHMMVFFTKMDMRLTILCLFLIFNNYSSYAAKLPRDVVHISDNSIVNNTKKYTFSRYEKNLANDQSYKLKLDNNEFKSEDTSVGRTFGRPFKKMIQAFIPLAFHLGMASTWAVVAALVGIKTLGVALIILKLLLVAGAAKIGAFFAQKVHSTPAKWEPQKEIHLHIHNGGHAEEHVEHVPGPWSREGQTIPGDGKHVDLMFNPYANGPQTISTPYGNYVRVDPVQSPLPQA